MTPATTRFKPMLALAVAISFQPLIASAALVPTTPAVSIVVSEGMEKPVVSALMGAPFFFLAAAGLAEFAAGIDEGDVFFGILLESFGGALVSELEDGVEALEEGDLKPSATRRSGPGGTSLERPLGSDNWTPPPTV